MLLGPCSSRAAFGLAVLLAAAWSAGCGSRAGQAPDGAADPDAGAEVEPPFQAGGLEITSVVDDGTAVAIGYRLAAAPGETYDVSIEYGAPDGLLPGGSGFSAGTASGDTAAVAADPTALRSLTWALASDLAATPEAAGLYVLRLTARGPDLRRALAPVTVDRPLAARAAVAEGVLPGLRTEALAAFALIGRSEDDLIEPHYVGDRPAALPGLGALDRVVALLERPLLAPAWLSAQARQVGLGRQENATLVVEAAGMQGQLGLDAAPPAYDLAGAAPLTRAVAALHARAGAALSPEAQGALEAQEAALGAPLAGALARVVQAMAVGAPLVAADNKGMDADGKALLRQEIDRSDATSYAGVFLGATRIAPTETPMATARAAALLAAAVDALRAVLAAGPQSTATGLLYADDSPLGRIEISGSGDDEHPGSAALLVDLGGNDRYPGRPASTMDLPVGLSVLVDVAGDDRYGAGADSLYACGAGIYGVAILADLGGNDSYACRVMSQGFAWHGVGVLWDGGGQDHYDGDEFVQGSALWGLGVLVDVAGDDLYSTTFAGQAFGGAASVGLLVDGGGNDTYTVRHVPAALDAEYVGKWNMQGLTGHGYLSYSQGSATGIRNDSNLRFAYGGGLGLLVDLAGSDRYQGSDEFGLANGYYYGVGGLVDAAGDDVYDAWDYTTGAAEHAAAEFLVDWAGADRYQGARDHAQGHGLDMSAGFLWDLGGDDSYLSSGESQGVAVKPRALGLLIDAAGTDSYGSSSDQNQGWARDPDVATLPPPVAGFLDLGGAVDAYSRAEAGNGATWKNALATSIGVDK